MSRRKSQDSPYQTRQQDQQRAEADHDVPGQVDGVDLGDRRLVVHGDACSSPCTTVFLPVLGSDSHEARPGIGRPPVTVPSELRWPSSVSGTSLVVFGDQLDRRELHRLVVVDPARQRVADDHLDRDGDGATLNGIRNPSRW